jgi:diguanylate cyclase (GGDEF)-like protein
MTEPEVDLISERRRVQGIETLRALDGETEPSLDRVVRLAAALTGTPHAAVHVIDGKHQHRVAAVNAPLSITSRLDTLCRHVIETGTAVASNDASTDPRFSFSSLVLGEHPVRFYAAAPLLSDAYGTLGTVCVWDPRPHQDAEEVLGWLGDLAALVIDSLEAGRAVRLLAEAAGTDELTELPNRRLIYDTLNRALARMDRDGAAVAVAFIDLDGFKGINDAHGHAVGDLVLEGVARRLRQVVRADEMVGRLGGDEFVVIATEGMVQAEAVERLGLALGHSVETPVGLLKIAVSVGVAIAEPGDTADRLLRRADLEMFAAKRYPSQG